jgi:DNA gyrase/topoisomerase IV subunit A
MNVVKQDLLAIKRIYREDRKSEIVSSVKDCIVPSETDEKPVETVAIALAYDHTFKRIPIKNFNMSQKDVMGAASNVVYCRIIETETN